MTPPICQIAPGSKVLVTGATGFTGSVLTRKLAEAGLKINAIARPTSNIKPLEDLDIKWFRGDVFDPATILQAASGVEYVFHLAAAFREAKSSEKDYWNVHVLSTKLLAKHVVKEHNFKRFVHISTIGVHGHIEEPPADETYRFSPGDGYQRTKLEAELWLAKFAPANGLSYTIIRPAAIYGPGDLRLLKLFKMATWPVFPLLGKGNCLYHLIHVDDLANGIIQSAWTSKAEGEAFIIGNKDPISIDAISAIVAPILRRKPPRVVRLPVGPFFMAADVCEKMCRPFGIEPPIYRRRVAFYTKDRHFRTDKMRSLLKYETRFSNQEGIEQTTKWYVENGWLKVNQ